MIAFRDATPKHKVGRKKCKNYSSYKKTLRADFRKRCGYCNDLDELRIRNYVIDHFLPRNPTGWTHGVPDNRYTNLVYACYYCNYTKSNKWPTKDWKKSNDGTRGFVNPTSAQYPNFFIRKSDGSIEAKPGSALGEYMVEHLGLKQDIHSLNWKFERILKQEKILKTLHTHTSDPSILADIKELQAQQGVLAAEIRGIYNK